MQRVNDMYKYNVKQGTMMLSNFPADFWEEYRTNHVRYDKLFNRMFCSFFYFMQSEDDELVDVCDGFREDVYNHLLLNQKKYEELYRVNVIPDEIYSLTENYNIIETMDKDISDIDENTYGERTDTESFTEGEREDSSSVTEGQRADETVNTIGQQTVTTTNTVAPYDSEEFANQSEVTEHNSGREDTIDFTKGEQINTSTNTKGEEVDETSSVKGEQTDNLERTYTEDYTLHRRGNIGVQTVTDMLRKHKDFWSAWQFYEYIFKEISAELLLI